MCGTDVGYATVWCGALRSRTGRARWATCGTAGGHALRRCGALRLGVRGRRASSFRCSWGRPGRAAALALRKAPSEPRPASTDPAPP
eukprot:2239729-Rhodomonas_salina.2